MKIDGVWQGSTRGTKESWDFRDARTVFACEGDFPRRF
jgi:hypothetical protein